MECLQDIKVLIVLAMPREHLREALEAGADDILEKPFKDKDLVEKVSRLASVKGLGKSAGWSESYATQ